MTAVQPMPLLLDPMPHASADAPIGVFDSGIGGLSIAQEIAQHLPNERILYYADTAHVPYGARSDQEIRKLTAQAIEWLYRQGCKIAVVACNTASAFSLDYLRDYYGERFPIVGLVPALKPAVIQTQSKVVAVLKLVPFVESGQQMSQGCLNVLQEILQPVVAQGADFLVLGCTHYPFLKDAIRQVFGEKLKLIDSGQAVARQTAYILIKNRLLCDKISHNITRIECYVSGNNAIELSLVLKHLVPEQITWTIRNLDEITA